jgi:hypothetical protein
MKIYVNSNSPKPYKLDKFIKLLNEDELKKLINEIEDSSEIFVKELVEQKYIPYSQDFYIHLNQRIRSIVYEYFISRFIKTIEIAKEHYINFSNRNLDQIVKFFDDTIIEVLKRYDYIFTTNNPTDSFISSFESKLWGVKSDLLNEMIRRSEIYLLGKELQNDPPSIVIAKNAQLIGTISIALSILFFIVNRILK